MCSTSLEIEARPSYAQAPRRCQATAAFAPSAASVGNKSAMVSVLHEIEQQIGAGDLAGAAQKLSNLRMRVDGCGVKADKNDWIVSCSAQLSVRALIDTMIDDLNGP